MNIKIFFFVKFFNFKEEVKVFFKNLKNPKFLLVNLLISLIYFFINPYRISKKFLKKRNKKDIHVYGETPISTFDKILKKCNISKNDYLIDLGSGRGKIAFFASLCFNCKVLAVEQIPIFTKIASFLCKAFKIKELNFVKKDMFELVFPKNCILYLYGTTLEKNEIFRFLEKIKKEIRIITISYPLTDYEPNSYKVTRFFEVTFPWGKTNAYLNIKIN